MPEEIAAIAYQNKEVVYGILFRATAETLRIIDCRAGELKMDWTKPLHDTFDSGKLQFFNALSDLRDRRQFARYLAPARKKKWVVYAKRPRAPEGRDQG